MVIRYMFICVFLGVVGSSFAAPSGKIPGCDSTVCKLPTCQCMSTEPPLGLKPEEIPQLVFLTFDDALQDWTLPFHEKIHASGVKNPNGCPLQLTYYICHDRTNYTAVNEFYNLGHEIASHTVTHYGGNRTYWSEGSIELWTTEVDNQRDILSRYGNIPKNKIIGHRAPYLQTGGDNTYTALQNLGMTYDTSQSTKTYRDPPIWPYTLDFGVTQECHTPCVADTYPGMWEMPIVQFKTSNGSYCGMIDSCPPPDDAQGEFDYLLSNFLRYNATRSPFSLYAHPYWFRDYPYTLDGYIQFIQYLSTLPDVYFITVSKGIEWLKNPLTLTQLKTNDIFACPPISNPTSCEPRICSYPNSEPGGSRNMASCTACPDSYPWVGNPNGNILP